MATNAELLEKLGGSISLPGLELDLLLEKSFAVKYKDQLDSVDSAEEREALKEALYSSYVEANTQRVNEGIIEIQSAYNNARSNIEAVISQAKEAVTTAAVPPVIGTAAPNPIREILEMKSKKEQLETILAVATDNLVRVILIANKIDYDLPALIVDTITLVGTAKSVLEAIPTKIS